MSKIDELKKLHQAQSITKKDFAFKELFMNSKAAKPYQNEDGTATLVIKGLASKFVPRYASENNPGYHTTVYLADGKKTGCFSGALLSLASFFYQAAGLDPNSEFNQVNFEGDNQIQVKVSQVDLADGKKTYNLEIMDGELDKGTIERLGSIAGQNVPLLFSGAADETKDAGGDA